jgi:hypothetical protein
MEIENKQQVFLLKDNNLIALMFQSSKLN